MTYRHPASWGEAEILAYTLRAELRAVEEGHRAWSTGDGYRVVSHETPDVDYRLDATLIGGILRVVCSCPSGVHRPDLPIPCKHAALVARRLERERAVVWRDGLWRDPTPVVCVDCGATIPEGAYAPDHAPGCPHRMPDDPFAGLGPTEEI